MCLKSLACRSAVLTCSGVDALWLPNRWGICSSGALKQNACAAPLGGALCPLTQSHWELPKVQHKQQVR
jgi:hypothetical protein